MIHYIKDSTLIMFNHQVQPDFDHFEPAQYMDRLVDSLQMQRPCFGLLTAVNMNNLCVMTDDYLTTFVTAGITHPSPRRANIGTINIILVIKGILSESAMVGAVVTATEAKGLALLSMGFDFLGTTTDAVIIAYEKQPRPCIEYAGPYTDLGKKITKTVITGIQEGIKKTGSDTS